MTNILLLLAVLGMLVGIYAVAMPTLTRKGWRLPFAGFFSEADDAVDEEFAPAFEMPRGSEVPAVVAPSIAPVEVPEPLPPVVTIDINEEEDDPTLMPLFEGLEEEVAAVAPAETPVAAAPEAQAPHLMLVHSQPADAVQAPETAATEPAAEAPQAVAEAPQAGPLAPEGNDMLSLFSEASDAGKGPNLILEAAGDVTITDLMEEVRKLREILDKRGVSKRRRYGNRRYEREWLGPVIVAVLTFVGLSALGYSLATSVLASDEVPLPAIEDIVASVQNVPPEQSQDLTAPAKELPQAPTRAVTTPASAGLKQPSVAANVPFNEPPPASAQPATRIKGVTSGSGVTQPSTNQPTANDQFAVSVVANPGAGLELFGLEVVQRLTQKGLNAQLVSLDDAGKPDALLVLGRSGEKRPGAWFCDPGPQGGSTLSHLLLESMATLPPDAAGADAAAHGPSTDFPCADIGAGRARIAATLVEMPTGIVTRNELRATAGDDLVAGITRYFNENGASVRSARASTRLVWPATGPISSYFGPSHPLGIDVAQSQGNIVAAMAGTVVFAGGNPCCSYGIYVVIDSPDGVRTLYGHLSTLAVRRGQKVKQGQTLGKVGNTGTSTGTHLHFEVIDRGIRQDPLRYLP